MIRVLITGADSYIGSHLSTLLENDAAHFEVGTLDMRGAWRSDAFVGYDAVVHVAGIAHMRENEKDAQLYFAVNRDLTEHAARAAKEHGVRQFVFFSSMSVYGMNCGRIMMETKPKPATFYGKSKWQAEQVLSHLADDGFEVAVLRPPMIYGQGCKGNYPRLSQLVQKLPLLPSVKNERSMLYIDCLCAFVLRLLESGEGGLFFPQNSEYVTTNELVREIAHAHGKRIWQPCGFGWLLSMLSQRVGVMGKLFGTLTYDRAMSAAFADEPQPTFAQSIQATEVRA